MGLLLNKTWDPRDTLERTRWKDIRKYLEQNPVEGIHPDMPHVMMVRRLREKGIHQIPAPLHELGRPESRAVEETVETRSVDAGAVLEAQWREPKSVADMSINELRLTCRERGIKVARTDKMSDLRAKLDGEDPSR